MENLNIPQHVAIILDGNGRWAKKRHLPRNMGHRQGSKVVEKIIEDAHDLGIKYLTVYAFSTENWKRPQDEVNALMKLLRDYLKTCIKRANKNNMKLVSKLNPSVTQGFRKKEDEFQFNKDAGMYVCKEGHMAIRKARQGKKNISTNQTDTYYFDIEKCKICP